MNKQVKDVQWIVQKNLTSQEDLNGLREACNKHNVNCIEINIIPFTTELPDFKVNPCNIYYGSTTFNKLIYKNGKTKNGLFFNPDTFSIENYIKKWGRHMLNYEASVTTFKDLMNCRYDGGKLLFIRPNDDNKSFAGEVKKFNEIGEWYEKLKTVGNIDLSLESKIIVSEPYNIKYEWRLWIVNKKVVAASKYREYFQLRKERGCPPEVVAFAENRCQEYTPHDIFVMDICLCGDEYYIVECGCMNGAGFYNADIENIVKSVSEYFREACCN
ncbi:ATP-grasp domain-containing protein [Terrimonas alba]|uniref:ATP-grasp domain-containing protein n=1 Tax=Terrimonas alba TaxID=3349636 RepID=UPI0035F2735B